MKRIITVILAGIMVFALCSCGDKTKSETEWIKVEGIYVDESYKDQTDDSLKLVYVMCNLTPQETIDFCSTDTGMCIDDEEYNSKYISGAASYMNSYYYSEFLEKDFEGKSRKVLYTYLIPEQELEKGKTITFTNYNIEDIDEIQMKTDDIKYIENKENIAKEADPDGYKKEAQKREPADSATAEKVKSKVNGYYFTFNLYPTIYKVEFVEPNNFNIRLTLNGSSIDNSGTYKITNGYIELYYTEDEASVSLPYKFDDNGDIVLEWQE